jgi:UDP-N-acetylmuramoylalanine--D-glutamate ligase
MNSLMDEYKNKKVLIMGLGINGGGVEAAKWFALKGANVLATDLRDETILRPSLKKLKKFKNIKFILGKHREKDFKEADLIIKNPGVPKDSPYLKIAQKNHIPIESDFSLFFKLCASKNLIGVTGSKGKSTAVSLIYKIFRKFNKQTQLAGNIRISPLAILNRIKNYNVPVILELSSWQLEDSVSAKKSPHVALITNILHEHLNRYKNFQEYVKAKKLIFKFQSQDDFLILNYKDKILKKIGGKEAKSKIIFYNKSPQKELAFLGGQKPQILGKHNLEHIMAAVAVAKIFKIPENIYKKAILEFRGLPGRIEFIKEIGKVKYYNDTTATMPDATVASIKTLSENYKLKPSQIVLIAGGADKNLDYENLSRTIKKCVGKVELLEGNATSKLEKELKKINFTNYTIYKDLKRAVKSAKKFSRTGGIILFSPGAASFGMFKNEFDRGDKFNKIVKSL